jgi:arylsulfatase A-like enzyme
MARPHLVFLLADQLRFDVLGAYGDQQCPTPALDALAERSVIFDRHFTVSPQCGPARTSLLTGLYPGQHGATINGWLPAERSHGMMKPGLELLPQKLADAGYRVTHVGVQHVRSDPELPTQTPGVKYVGPASSAEHLNLLRDRGLQMPDTRTLRDPIIDFERGKKTVFSSTSPRPAIFPLREDLYYDQALSQSMAEEIRGYASNGREGPLALLGMFWLPHPPLWAPRQFATMIDPADVKLPGTVGKWCYGMSPMQLANVPGQLGAHLSEQQWREIWAVYLGMVAMLDQCVAKVIDALRAAGLYDDAVIVFSSDHGEMLGSHRLFG